MGRVKFASILLVASAVVLSCALALVQRGDRIGALQTPDLRPPPTIADEAGPEDVPEGTIGGFERVEEAPEYEILEQTNDEREGARSALLLIDTRSRSEKDFTLITRDVKARYKNLDSASLRFIDSETVLDYNGGAVIFNTPAGAYNAGYLYGPPNTEGYLVDAAE